MQTLPQPQVQAKYATVYDEPATIAKVHDVLYVVYENRIEPFAVAMAPWTVLLGDCELADTQQLMDRINGGAAQIACDRLQEVA